ncbi:hypothetical protein L5515_004947 [Caenorhabditis briggsae]|uniref:Uncharacterized protein n=1 Tax=Caenorhabditis briggsae TaxID=6238 RepID=A0AAE9ENC6_CAEBR|nr:hypothetical protein L5515_004947 [Caenorhabditis briggsae]
MGDGCTTYSVCGLFSIIMPVITFWVMGDEDFITAFFYALVIPPVILIFLLSKCAYKFEHLCDGPGPSKSQKISVLRIGLCTMLFCIIVQSLILCYFINFGKDLDKDLLTTIKCFVLALGLIYPALLFMVSYHSVHFFHPFDIFDSYFFILWVIGIVIQVNIYPGFPFYFYIIKAILIVILSSSEIMELRDFEQKDYVVFRSWSGKIYRGKPLDFFFILGLDLSDVMERIAPNTWKKSRNGLRLPLSIIWMKKVPRKVEVIEC